MTSANNKRRKFWRQAASLAEAPLNDRGQTLIWALVLALAIQAAIAYLVYMALNAQTRQSNETRPLDARGFISPVEALLADATQCTNILPPIVNSVASASAQYDLPDGAFAAGVTLPNWGTLAPGQKGGVLLNKLGPVNVPTGANPFIVDNAANPYYQPAGQMSIQTWFSASGLTTPPTIKNDYYRRINGQAGYLPLTIAPSGVYLKQLALLEVNSFTDTPGLPRAFEVWGLFDKASDAADGVTPGLVRLAQVAASTKGYTAAPTDPIQSCVLRSVARLRSTPALTNPDAYGVSCGTTGQNALVNATASAIGGNVQLDQCVAPGANIDCGAGNFLIGIDSTGAKICKAGSELTGGTAVDQRQNLAPTDAQCPNKWQTDTSVAYFADPTGTHFPTTAEYMAQMPAVCSQNAGGPVPGGYLYTPISGCVYSNGALAFPNGQWVCSQVWCCAP